jgi:hypothetical protein
VIHRYERLDFEQEIMVPLRKMGDALGDAAKFLLFPLIKPELEPMFSIENFYAPQGKIREADEEQGLDLTETEDPGNDLTEVRNNRHRAIVRDFFAFAHDKAQFTVSEFMDTLTVAQIKAYSEENALPNVILSMYAMQELDLEGWKATERFTTTPHGEFELSWCLEGLPEAYVQPKRICFSAADPNVPELAFVVRTEAFERTVTMTNFHVEVYR